MSDLAEADPAGSAAAEPAASLLRDRSGSHRVTNIELFFDLVYVFAVTQLSHYLLGHSTVPGALQAGLLLVMIWLVWSYTTWVTNWLDPERMAVRLLLVLLMLISLAMSASLPRAFEDLGLWVGVGYAVQQIGRSVFMVIALRGHAAARQLRAHPGLVRGQRRARRGRRVRPRLGPGPAVAARRGCGPGRRRGRLRHAGARPVPHLGLDHRGRPLRRALPGVHPDRAGRVDRHHRRDPGRQNRSPCPA